MRTNYSNQDLPPAMRPESEIPPGLRGLRPSVRKVFEQFGLSSKGEMARLGPDRLDEIRNAVDFIEKNPHATDPEIEAYFRERANISNTIADMISQDGREGLQELRKKLPETRVN